MLKYTLMSRTEVDVAILKGKIPDMDWNTPNYKCEVIETSKTVEELEAELEDNIIYGTRCGDVKKIMYKAQHKEEVRKMIRWENEAKITAKGAITRDDGSVLLTNCKITFTKPDGEEVNFIVDSLLIYKGGELELLSDN